VQPPKAALGGTGLDISRVGFGAWAIGGGGWRYAWGDQDDAESAAALRHAVAAGVNWIDTAAVYGLGHSEEVIGRVLGDLPEADRPHVFTKCGLVWSEQDRSAPPHRIMRPASVRREVEASLRRLRVERIDLYQVHWPDTGASLEWDEQSGGAPPGADATPLEDYWQVMADLRREGKVAAIGLSNHSLEQVRRAERVAHVDAIQPPFSLLDRSAAELIAWAADQRIGVIVYSPLQSGLLTGAFSAQRVADLPANDWRRGSPDFTTGLTANLALVDRLRPLARHRGASLSALAVAWALSWPGVTGAIVGARRPGQVDEWVGGAALALDAADLDAIAAALASTGAGVGPRDPRGAQWATGGRS
jgi:aryl-alcohol dehydrogenase-like predicted oxidoreductase